MKENKIFEALTDVDGALIRGTDAPLKPEAGFRIKRVLIPVAAAFLVAAVLCAVLIPTLARKSETPAKELVTIGGMTFTPGPGNDSYTLTCVGKTPGNNVILFEMVKGLPVTQIGENALAGASVGNFYIPATVTSIASNAFENCASLSSICFVGSKSAWDAAFDEQEGDRIPDGVAIRCDALYPLTDEPYVYPVTPEDEEWKEMSVADRTSACSVPRPVLESMTTPALVETIVTCPFFINVYTSSISFDDGFRLLENVFDGVRVLYERADAADSVKAFIEKAEKESENGDPGKLAIYAATLLEHLERTVIRREDDDGQILKAGVYRRSGSGAYSAVILKENRTFTFPSGDATSNFLLAGSYSVKDGYLYLGPLAFEILKDGNLKFSGTKTNEAGASVHFAAVPGQDVKESPFIDGTVFILTE